MLKILKAENLSYRAHNTPILDNVSLTFIQKELFAILGPNGSGKSTLLKTLSGIWKKTSGNVLWNDQDLLTKPRHEISKTVSFVPQNPQIPFAFSVFDFVAMGRYPHKNPMRSKEKECVEKALHTVDAWHFRSRLITELSVGERQRIYIARALATESRVLLLDEPTANLDIRHQLEIWQLLRSLLTQGRLIIVANHDLTATEQFADKVAILSNGRCIASGPFSSVVTDQLLKEVFGCCSHRSKPID